MSAFHPSISVHGSGDERIIPPHRRDEGMIGQSRTILDLRRSANNGHADSIRPRSVLNSQNSRFTQARPLSREETVMKNPKDSENASRKAPAAAGQHRFHTAISPRHDPFPKTRDVFDQVQSHRDRMASVSAMRSHKSATICKIPLPRCASRRLRDFPCQPHRNRIFYRPACGIGSAHRKKRVDVASQNRVFTGGFSDRRSRLLLSSSVGVCAALISRPTTRDGQPHRRPNSFSISPCASFTQVGRPWLHWPECGVISISRSNAFISVTERMRPARTDPWHAMVAAT